jgi:VIT1/CCC1 family predicted Fe2+/Mn2+ transporter
VSHQLSPGWSLTILADVGVPYMKIMEAYGSESQRNDRIVMGVGGVDEKRHTEKSTALLELLRHWFDNAQVISRTTGTKNRVSQELSREIALGRLQQKLEGIRGSIEMLHSASWLMDQLQSIEEMLRFMK